MGMVAKFSRAQTLLKFLGMPLMFECDSAGTCMMTMNNLPFHVVLLFLVLKDHVGRRYISVIASQSDSLGMLIILYSCIISCMWYANY